MSDKVTRHEAAVAVEDLLLTPRVLNAERYGKLIEELGGLVRGAAEQAEAIRRAAEELRAAQATAARTLEELRTRSETIGRSVTMIDQRLARGEAILARASEQAREAQIAAARLGEMAAPDAVAIERRISEAERASTARVEDAAREATELIEAMVRDAIARGSAGAAEAAHRAAVNAASGLAADAIGPIVADAEARIAERQDAIGRALLEQATESVRAVEGAAHESAERAGATASEAIERLARMEADAALRLGTVRADFDGHISARLKSLATMIERAEQLTRTESVEPLREMAAELGERISRAEAERTALTDVVAAASAMPRMRETAGSPGASTASASLGDAEARARALVVMVEERLRAASAHAEAMGAWIGQVLGHAQQTGAALERLVARAGSIQGPGAPGHA